MSNTLDKILTRLINETSGVQSLSEKEMTRAGDALYQLILKKLIGEDKDIVYGEGSEVVMNAILSQSNNKLRAEQRQTLAKLFNKEIK